MVVLMSILSVTLALWLAYVGLLKLQKGWPRVALVLLLFPMLAWPAWTFDSYYARGVSACILLWVCPAKLLAIATNTPLDILPPNYSFFHFALVNLLPLRIVGSSNGRRNSKSTFQVLHLVQVAILSITTNYLHYNRERLSHWLVSGIYCIFIYSAVGVTTSTLANLAEIIAGLEAAPSFNNPFVATSLSEFWGRRWNLVVTAMLRANVYDPILALFSTPPKTLTGSKSIKPDPQLNRYPLVSRCVGALASFLVSGLLHEAIFCCVNHSLHATWEQTAFFVLHGVFTVLEVLIQKRVFNDKLKLPRPVSIFLTLGFMYVTVDWLFLPPLTRPGSDAKLIAEIHGFQSMVFHLITFYRFL